MFPCIRFMLYLRCCVTNKDLCGISASLSHDGLLSDGDGDGEDSVGARRRGVHLGRRRRPPQRALLKDPQHLVLALDHNLLQAL